MPREYRVFLEDIVDSAERIHAYTFGLNAEQFLTDAKTQDAVVRNLEIIGEAARNLPEHIRDMMPEVEWRKIVAMRNILSHEYFAVNLHVVWDIVTHKIAALEAACRGFLEQ